MHIASHFPRIQGLSHLVLHCLPILWFGARTFLRIGFEGVVQPQYLGTLGEKLGYQVADMIVPDCWKRSSVAAEEICGVEFSTT